MTDTKTPATRFSRNDANTSSVYNNVICTIKARLQAIHTKRKLCGLATLTINIKPNTAIYEIAWVSCDRVNTRRGGRSIMPYPDASDGLGYSAPEHAMDASVRGVWRVCLDNAVELEFQSAGRRHVADADGDKNEQSNEETDPVHGWILRINNGIDGLRADLISTE